MSLPLPLPLLPAFVLLPGMEEPIADSAGHGVELGLGFQDTSLLLLDPDNKQIKQCYIRIQDISSTSTPLSTCTSY
jgi:hypothetical protein